MRTFIFNILWLSLLATHGLMAAGHDSGYWLERLDESLARRDQYEQQKLARISILKTRLDTSRDDRGRYAAASAIFEEYKSYRYDSAYAYARQSAMIAERAGDAELMVRARCAEVACMTASGMFKDAFDIIETIDAGGMTAETRLIYFETYSLLCYGIANYNGVEPYYTRYNREGTRYADSLVATLPPQSDMALLYSATRQELLGHEREAIAIYRRFLALPAISTHDKAVAAVRLGGIYHRLGDKDNALSCYARSAICDNETATREITSLFLVAQLLNEKGDTKRAHRYAGIALDYINFYNARLRKIEINSIFPHIEQNRYELLLGRHTALMTIVVLAAVSIAVFIILLLVIRRKNALLAKANMDLQEMNAIKDEYVGRSFIASSTYIDRMDNILKTIDNKITARQYGDIREMARQSMVKEERRNMYADFDKAFLNLFPGFVEGYNRLFAEEDRKWPPTGTLTPEMRIFALIRMGIGGTEKIAGFLNYSANTVLTYKARAKGRATCGKDRFEREIMELR